MTSQVMQENSKLRSDLEAIIEEEERLQNLLSQERQENTTRDAKIKELVEQVMNFMFCINSLTFDISMNRLELHWLMYKRL